jgi:hypothetical protein
LGTCLVRFVSISLALTFRKDAESDSYSRSVFSILDLFGNIGGVFEILQVTGGLIVGYFSRDLFLYSILTKLYQVNRPNSDRPFTMMVPNVINANVPVSKEIDNSDVSNEPKSSVKTSKMKVKTIDY